MFGRFTRATGVVVGVLAAGGCDAPECVELCEEEQACPDTSQPDPAGCEADCDRVRSVNEASGCSDAYEDMLSCIDDAGVCEVDDQICQAAQRAWFDCTSDYCEQNPSAPQCQSPRG